MPNSLDPSKRPTTCQPHARGLMLPCPHCGDAAATITFVLAAGDRFYCADHDGDFSANDVREFIAKWTAVLAWIDQMPMDGRLTQTTRMPVPI